jgi:hypothetical protein
MDNMETFFTISLKTLNLFSFMLGVLYAMSSSYGWYGRRNVWLLVVVYATGVATFYYFYNGQK